jgi:uncharacterized protein
LGTGKSQNGIILLNLMNNNNAYFLPYKDKYIIYKPLNKLAFIGNSAMKGLIEDLIDGKTVDENKNKDAIGFINRIGFLNQYDFGNVQVKSSAYKPTVCVLCMTSDCNFHCSYCFANGGDVKKVELPLATGQLGIDWVYQNAVETGTPNMVISFHGGGEPTLPFNKLKKLTEFARAKNITSFIELTSNGYWNKEKTGWIISNIDNLTLSFDGSFKTQNLQRPLKSGKPTFNLIMNNICELDKNKFKYGIRLTVTNDSLHLLEENIGFLCRETQCSTFQVEPAFAAGRAETNKQSINNTSEFIHNFLSSHDIALNFDRKLYYSGARPWVITDRFCSAHENALVITPEGILSSCYEISGTEHPLAEPFHFGAMKETGEIDIDFQKRAGFQNKIEERKELCRGCFCYWHCAGDCPAKTFLPVSFDNMTFSERCHVNQEITKELILRNISQGDGIWFENNLITNKTPE